MLVIESTNLLVFKILLYNYILLNYYLKMFTNLLGRYLVVNIIHNGTIIFKIII
jgi:hypothetical protein